jgi:hypothetical protein
VVQVVPQLKVPKDLIHLSTARPVLAAVAVLSQRLQVQGVAATVAVAVAGGMSQMAASVLARQAKVMTADCRQVTHAGPVAAVQVL